MAGLPIPGIDTGGGGFTGSSSATSSLANRQKFSATVGGNAGIQFHNKPAAQAALFHAGAILTLGILGGIAWSKWGRRRAAA